MDYELFIHLKQGDDFAHWLEKHEGDVACALRSWAEDLRAAASVCDQLATHIGDGIVAEADGHFISFNAQTGEAETRLAELANKGLLSVPRPVQ